MMPRKHYDLEKRLIRFGAAVCRLCGQLPEGQTGKLVSSQLIRCCTSPFANYGEAQAAESGRDFIHKLQLCLKELRETRAWLLFIAEMDLQPDADTAALASECGELIAIFRASIGTARRNQEPMSNVE